MSDALTRCPFCGRDARDAAHELIKVDALQLPPDATTDYVNELRRCPERLELVRIVGIVDLGQPGRFRVVEPD